MYTKKELEALIETATEQLTADYACYFGKRDAEIMIELAKEKMRSQTNADSIRAMSDEELNVFLYEFAYDSRINKLKKGSFIDWLKQEVE